MTRRTTVILRSLLILLGAACILKSLPWLFFGCMGLFSVIADVGIDEHRRLVRDLLVLGGLLFTVGLAFVVVGIRFMRPSPMPKGRCLKCGYDLTGVDARCPECGSLRPLDLDKAVGD